MIYIWLVNLATILDLFQEKNANNSKTTIMCLFFFIDLLNEFI